MELHGDVERIAKRVLGSQVSDEAHAQLVNELSRQLESMLDDVHADASRELAKAADALEAAEVHFANQGRADAALHLAAVRYNPLAAKVSHEAANARDAARRFASYMRAI